MKLQLALDTLTLDECMTLLAETKGSVDIAEVGTPFIIEEGMRLSLIHILTASEKIQCTVIYNRKQGLRWNQDVHPVRFAPAAFLPASRPVYP